MWLSCSGLISIHRWRQEVETRIDQVVAATEALLQHNCLPELATFRSHMTEVTHIPTTPSTSTPIAEDPTESFVESGVVEQPMGVVAAITANTFPAQSQIRKPQETDLVARGQISADVACDLFDLFNRKLNQYVWGGVAMSYDNLDSARKSSALLSTAILAIASLHLPERELQFDTCYNEFMTLVERKSISRSHTLDDVRGLILGAFWFPDLSWKLSGLAVRISTELNVHRHFSQFLRGDKQKLEEARLWYLLYVCDHHFSIAYGRPTMMLDPKDIHSHDNIPDKLTSRPADVRLLAQVSLFIHLSEIYSIFGIETSVALGEHELANLQQHMNRIENWRAQWELRLGE